MRVVIGALVVLLVAAALLAGLSKKSRLWLLRQRAAAAHAKAESGKVQQGKYLSGCPGEDAGPEYRLPQFENYGVSNGWDWVRWDGTYPEQWIEWFALPRYTYYVKQNGLPDTRESQWQTTFLVKADGPQLAAALAAQIPAGTGADPDGYEPQPIAKVHGMSMTRLTVEEFHFRRRDQGRNLRLRVEYGPELDGWCIVRLFNHRIGTWGSLLR